MWAAAWVGVPSFHQRRVLNYSFANMLEKNRCLKPVQAPGSAAAVTSELGFV